MDGELVKKFWGANFKYQIHCMVLLYLIKLLINIV